MSANRLWELLARKHNDELTEDEQKELELLLRQQQEMFELNETFLRIKELQVRKLSSQADEERSRQAIAAQLGPLPSPPRSIKKGLWMTAVACGLLIIGILWWSLPKHNNVSSPASQNEIATSSSKSRVQLPDGSTVILNKQSRLTYNKDFGVSKREISLTGEAYFDIARNESIPLTVTAGSVKIRVMGTAFNVRAYAQDSTIETALIRGSIEVSSTDDPERTIRMRPNEKIIFGKDIPSLPSTPGIKIPEHRMPTQAFVQMNRIKPNPTDSTINEIVWVQDKLVFSKEPFYSLAQKMERWYQVKIRFKDTISQQLSLTGSLEKETLTEALDALKQLTPFNYRIDSGIVTISKKINTIN